MHPVLLNIVNELNQLALQIATIPAGNPFAIAHNNWTFPAITSEELRERVEEISRDVQELGKDVLDAPIEARLNDYPRRIAFVRSNTVPQLWGNSAAAMPAVSELLNGLVRALRPALQVDASQEASSRLSRLRAQVGGLETRLKLLQPRTANLESMVKSIEDTYNAAQELPAALEDVHDARDKIQKAQGDVEGKQGAIDDALGKLVGALDSLEEDAVKARKYIEECESAYRTNVGKSLAGAFHERSKQLYWSMWGWVVGLVGSLAGGVYWSSHKIGELVTAAHADASPSIVVLDGVMAAISIAAPVWLGWLATRQIGQSFRLSEDYAFKASVARSYEGYRKEAVSVNEGLAAELLASAIRRVDEEPLRVVEAGSPGSPWHDLASSPTFAKALKTVPDFAAQVRDLAAQALKAKESPVPKTAD